MDEGKFEILTPLKPQDFNSPESSLTFREKFEALASSDEAEWRAFFSKLNRLFLGAESGNMKFALANIKSATEELVRDLGTRDMTHGRSVNIRAKVGQLELLISDVAGALEE